MVTNPNQSSQNSRENRENYIRLIESQHIICDRYTDVSRIDENAGDGYFSLVFKAKDVLNKGKEVALKFFSPLHYGNTYRLDCFERESQILKDLQGQPNILPLIQEKADLNLVLETKEGVRLPLSLVFYSSELGRFNITHYIYKEKVDFLTNILFFREICKAVQRIHNKRIMHRDLKPGNFLVFNKRYVCLSDFGTARYSSPEGAPILDHYPGPRGDKRYAAPELLCGLHFSDHHNFCADIYSLGTILFELFTKTILSAYIFKEDDVDDILAHFHRIPERNRIEIFDGIIEGFSKSRQLPSIREFDISIPKMIAREIDMLYKSMAYLDYRERQTNFQKIFLRINICEKVIKHHTKIEKWIRRRKKRRNREGCPC